MVSTLALAPLLATAAANPQLGYAPWQPAAEYITAGQDEPGYRAWLARSPWRAAGVAQLHNYLGNAGVAYVVPTWQLLRTATDWQRCGAEPFDLPPVGEWANIVQTLRYVRDYVVPVVGAVEPVSAYRNSLLNRCAGGAANSVHQHLSAIDLVPRYPLSRDELMRRLCAIHAVEGPRYSVGLGFYAKMRFHVDSWKFRTWGRNSTGVLACARSYEIAHRTLPPTVPASGQAPLTAPMPAVRPLGNTLAPPWGSPPAPSVQPAPQRDPLAPR